MPGSTVGEIFRLTTFGKSRGTVICVKIGRCLEEMKKKLDFTQSELNLRISGQSNNSSQKKEHKITSIKDKGR
jgi:chorismate synthase